GLSQAAADLIIGPPRRQIEPGGELPVEEIWFGEVEVELLAPGRQAEAQTQILAATEQVPFTDRDVAQYAFRRRIADADRQFAGRLFRYLGGKHHFVRRTAARLIDLHPVDEVQATQPRAARAPV